MMKTAQTTSDFGPWVSLYLLSSYFLKLANIMTIRRPHHHLETQLRQQHSPLHLHSDKRRRRGRETGARDADASRASIFFFCSYFPNNPSHYL